VGRVAHRRAKKIDALESRDLRVDDALVVIFFGALVVEQRLVI